MTQIVDICSARRGGARAGDWRVEIDDCGIAWAWPLRGPERCGDAAGDVLDALRLAAGGGTRPPSALALCQSPPAARRPHAMPNGPNRGPRVEGRPRASASGTRIPAIAVLGGGENGAFVDLALRCSFRIAVPGASIALPQESLPCRRDRQPVSAVEARRMGLVDALVPERHLAAMVLAMARGRFPGAGPSLRPDDPAAAQRWSTLRESIVRTAAI